MKEVKINLDVLCDDAPIFTEAEILSQKMAAPIFVAPVAGIKGNYGADISEYDYNCNVLKACEDTGIVGFTGREQVELNNKKYQSEVARLNTEKNKARDSIYNLIIEKIQYEVGHRLSRKKAEAIWNRAYEDGHSFGFYEIRCRLSDLIDLAITLLGGDK